MTSSERLLSVMKEGRSYTREELIKLAELDERTAHKLFGLMVTSGYISVVSECCPVRYEKRLA